MVEAPREPVAPEPAELPPEAVAEEPAGPIVVGADAQLATPESVTYDAAADVYYVSNIDGVPYEADGKGFIAKVSPEGKVIERGWIESGKAGVTLNAPKGLAVAGDTLYVGDLDRVRMFDTKTGAAKGEVKIPKATFVNDVFAAGDTVYVTDSGLEPSEGGLKPTGHQGIYKIQDGKLTTLAQGKQLKGPNGILVVDDQVWVVTMGANELYQLVDGKPTNVTTLPAGSLDGIVALPDGRIAISSWEGKAVYAGRPGEEFTPIAENIESPADIGFDDKRNHLLIPSFNGNELQFMPLPQS